MNSFEDNKEHNTLMNSFIKTQLTSVSYGSEVPMTSEELSMWKPTYFEVTGLWGAAPDTESKFYTEGRWVITPTTKKRVYPVGVIPKGSRAELYYGVMKLTGEIPVEFHNHFSHLVKWWGNWINFHTCEDCGVFTHPTDSTHEVCYQ